MKIDLNIKGRLFGFGQIVMTPGALEACDPFYLVQCLGRHMRGDWGNVDDEDKATNNEAVKTGLRILSAYPLDPAQPCKGFGSKTL